MPAAPPVPIPYPPVDPPADLPELVSQPLVASWRLHWEDDPTNEVIHPTGRYRFDAPSGEYGVTYVNEDRMAPFAEAYVRTLPRKEAERRWSRISSVRDLRVLQLDAEGVAAAFGLDLRLSTELDYTRTQAWSLAWHTWYPQLDAIRFLGRKAMTHLNYCLYLDRCGPDLTYVTEGRLVDLRDAGIEACDRHRIAPELYF